MPVLRVIKGQIEFQNALDLGQSIDKTIDTATSIFNQILKLQHIAQILPDFIEYDACLPEVVEKERQICEANRKAYEYNSDPSGLRTGQATKGQIRINLEATRAALINIISKTTLQARQITLLELKEVEQNVEDTINIAFPMDKYLTMEKT
ncbi:MAG: hypothetical protein EZS28_030970 [Streblomastix strix]|uniref:Uncharacterized protein n=1 Tax=Streblomastix strix TaxID=222440 RepID=A0A5J4UTS8_9EUKA|nr:MAG: hypothetical protein EZS28_030970 [Streblomastix strix]